MMSGRISQSSLGGRRQMDQEISERLKLLCEQAGSEQDANRLLELVEEINRILGNKEQQGRNSGLRLRGQPFEP